jgi:hypothetical protein
MNFREDREGDEGGDMGERISYWLVPAEPDKAHLAQIISELAQRFDSPAFEPHLTLYSGPRDARDEPEEIIRAATHHFPPIALRTSGVGGSQEFTKTLFVEFCGTEPLLTLSEQLKRSSARPEPYALRPHLSLIYASLDARVKQQLVEKISVPPSVRFDAVKAIISRERTRSGEDVRAWRVVAEAPLAVH